MRVALIVPVPAATSDGELLRLHAANIEQTRALGRAGVSASLYVKSKRGFRRDLGFDTRLCAVADAETGPIPGAPLVRAGLDDGCEVLHCFHLLDVRTLAFAVMKAGKTAVFAEYNTGLVPHKFLRARVLARLSRRLSGVFFTAEQMAQPFVQAKALDRRAPVFAVPEISSLLPEPKHPNRIERPPGDPKYLVVARAAPFKRPDVMLAAFKLIVEQQPKAQLTWLSNEAGPAHSWLQHQIHNNPSLARRVTLKVGVAAHKMTDAYQGHHVLLHASEREACGFAFVEALQQGLPVAGSFIPPFVALGRGGAARLVAVGDARALAEAAVELFHDPGARQRARDRFVSALNWDAIATRKAAVYRGQSVSSDY